MVAYCPAMSETLCIEEMYHRITPSRLTLSISGLSGWQIAFTICAARHRNFRSVCVSLPSFSSPSFPVQQCHWQVTKWTMYQLTWSGEGLNVPHSTLQRLKGIEPAKYALRITNGYREVSRKAPLLYSSINQPSLIFAHCILAASFRPVRFVGFSPPDNSGFAYCILAPSFRPVRLVGFIPHSNSDRQDIYSSLES